MEEQVDDLTAEISVDSDHSAIIRLRGEIDIATSHVLEHAARQAIDDGATRLVIEMTDVTFMDSSGIAVLIRLRSGAAVTIRRPSEPVKQLITVTGLTQTLQVEP